MFKVCNQYVSSKTMLLVLLEQAEIDFCVFSATWLRLGQMRSLIPLAVAGAVIQLCLYCTDLYTFRAAPKPRRLAFSLAQALAVASLVLAAVYFVLPSVSIGRGIFAMTMSFVFLLLSGTRLALGRSLSSRTLQQCIVVGTGPLVRALAMELRSRQDLDCHVVVHPDPESLCSVDGYRLSGWTGSLGRVVPVLPISKIFIDPGRADMPTREFLELKIQGVHFESVQSALASLTGRIWLEHDSANWLVFADGFRRSKLSAVSKRTLDLVLATCGALVAAPLMLAIAAAIRLDSTGPIFYRQARVGLHGRIFHLIKFRSMCLHAESPGVPQWACADDPRITRIGRLLRRLRLDELPQCFNILAGHMSFVGPRPERPEFVDLLGKDSTHYHQRHTVRPGLTGWAQINYRYAATIDDSYRKLEYDLFYLKNMSLLFDIVIVLKTIHAVTAGVGTEPEVIAEEAPHRAVISR
jgi:sugar transferase (PEP-CTERM system associated)